MNDYPMNRMIVDIIEMLLDLRDLGSPTKYDISLEPEYVHLYVMVWDSQQNKDEWLSTDDVYPSILISEGFDPSMYSYKMSYIFDELIKYKQTHYPDRVEV